MVLGEDGNEDRSNNGHVKMDEKGEGEQEKKEEKSLSQEGEGKEEEQGEQMDDELVVCLPCGEGEEGRDAKAARTPAKVSEEEKARRELTHTPFRSWCKFCVMGRGISESHRSKSEEQKQEDKELRAPRVCMDYLYLGEQDKEAKENPMLVMVDEATGENMPEQWKRKEQKVWTGY